MKKIHLTLIIIITIALSNSQPTDSLGQEFEFQNDMQ